VFDNMLLLGSSGLQPPAGKIELPLTPGIALRLGKLCGNGPDLWLNLQKRYAQQELARRSRRFRLWKWLESV
jgi:plasmid maintenance system antidote protein VapI